MEVWNGLTPLLSMSSNFEVKLGPKPMKTKTI